MKILFVLNLRYSKSGITEQILYLKDRLERESYEVNLISTYGNVFGRVSGVVNTFRMAVKTDLIIGVGCSYFGFFPIVVAALAAFFLNKKILFNFHGGQAEKFIKKYNFIAKKVLNNKKIVVASDYLDKVFKENNYHSEKISNIFNFEYFPGKSIEFSWNRRVLWARSFEDLYQPELALEVAKLLTEKYDYEFHFFGNGSKYKSLKNKYESSKIFFRGLIDRKSLLGEYKNFSILINTTLNDNIPNTIFEAGYYKLLVISSKVGGISTTFSAKEIIFVEKNDIKSYVDKILDVMENPGKYDLLRENLHNKIIGFNWDSVKENWLTLLKHYEKGN